METDVDITPKSIDPRGPSEKKDRVYIFQESEWRQIRENPNNLTREGILEKIKVWGNSQNKHTAAKYKTMLNQCEKIAPSGKTTDGRIVYSRSAKGVPNWVEADKETLNVYEEKKTVKKKKKQED